MLNQIHFFSFIENSFARGHSENDTILFTFAIIYIAALVICYLILRYQMKESFQAFIKKIMIIPTITGGFVIYFIGYHVNDPSDKIYYTIFLSLFSTARLFILGNNLIDVHEHVNEIYKLWFSIFSISAALISTSLLINKFGKKIKTKFQIIFNQSNENFIFFGVNEAGVTLAKDILRRKPLAFIVFVQNFYKEEDVALMHLTAQLKVLFIDKDSFFDSVGLKHQDFLFQGSESKKNKNQPEGHIRLDLKKMSLYKKIKDRPTNVFLLSEKEDQNIHLSQLFINEIKKQKFKQSVQVHIRTFTKNIEEIYDEWFNLRDENIVIHLHNKSTIAATQLVNSNLPIDWLINIPGAVNTNVASVNKDFTVMFIGFGLIGHAALRKLFEQGQFIGSQFKAIVIDENMDAQKGRFVHRYPGIMDTLQENLEFHELEAGGVKFYDLLEKRSSAIDYIVIGLGDDELNVQIAYDVKHVMNKVSNPYKIFVQVISDDYYRNFCLSEDSSIQVFGRDKDVFTEDIIIKRGLEKIACKIHGSYNENAQVCKRDSWDNLSKVTQQSNISVAEHIHTKLALSGFTIERIRQFENYEDFEKNIGIERILNLAKTEHLRWNAFHFINGWSNWDLNKIPEDFILNKKNKNEKYKLHACLVNWDELKNVSLRFGEEDYYKYDLECMKDIYKMIKNGLYEEN